MANITPTKNPGPMGRLKTAVAFFVIGFVVAFLFRYCETTERTEPPGWADTVTNIDRDTLLLDFKFRADTPDPVKIVQTHTDTVFVDTGAVIEDWYKRRIYEETWTDSPARGQLTATVERNRLTDFTVSGDVKTERVTETRTVTRRPRFLGSVIAGPGELSPGIGVRYRSTYLWGGYNLAANGSNGVRFGVAVPFDGF